MVAEPTALAVTTPEALTLATVELLELHVTDLFVALLGFTVSVRVAVSPTSRVTEVGDRLTEETETGVEVVVLNVTLIV
jgi:hypothetical protein